MVYWHSIVKRHFFVILMMLTPVSAPGQFRDKTFTRITTEEGLSQSWVRAIYQDETGYMWFGTADGLNRYDGNEFKYYFPRHNGAHGLESKSIYYIDRKNKEELWVCTAQGIYVYNRPGDTFKPFKHISVEGTYCVTKGPEGQIWIGTFDGLYRFHPKDSSLVHYKNIPGDSSSLSHNHVRCLYFDSQQNLWVGTQQGLNLFNKDTGHFQRFYHTDDPHSLSGNAIWGILEDRQNRIWIGSGQGGLDFYPLKPGGITDVGFTRVMEVSAIQLLLDHNNQLWVGCGAGQGLYVLDLNEFIPGKTLPLAHYKHASDDNKSLSDNSITSLYQDQFNDIWIGTYGGGINFYSERTKPFQNVKVVMDPKKSISSNIVNTFYEEDQYLWIGTETGLDQLNKTTGTFHHFSHNHGRSGSLKANAIYSLLKDSRDNFWVGTWSGGLHRFKYHQQTFQHIHLEADQKSSPSNNIFALCEDSAGYLWIGTIENGLIRYSPKTGKYKQYVSNNSDPHSLQNNSINDILLTRENRLYISTFNALELYDPHQGHFIHYTHDPSDKTSLTSGNILCLFEDSKGNIWLGTNMGLELFHEKQGQFSHYTMASGLPNNTIQAILEDKNGNFWLSTNKGLVQFKDAIHQPKDPELRIYNTADGLPGNEFVKRAAYKNKDGKMYFGTTQGYTSFYPDSIRDNPVSPPIILTGFTLIKSDQATNEKFLDKNINMKEELHLNYKQSDFTITYAALNYLSPENNRYKFRLLGYEEKWHHVGHQRNATYTNLSHGKYTFEVMGSNNDGIWSETPKRLPIIIHPPWWKTLVFKAFLIVFIATAIFGFYRLRFSLLQHQKKLLEHKVEERTDELKQLNSLLEARQKEITKQNLELSRHQNDLEDLVKERTAELEKAKVKAEASDKLKSAFLANMSHEIRTPLNTIVGFSNLLKEEEYTTQERDHFVEMIDSNSESLLVLINDILDISRIEANQLVLSRNKFDAHAVLVEMEKSINLKNQKNIDVIFDNKDKGQSLVLYNDRVRFRQVVTNLLTNAYKYTDSGYIRFGYEKQPSRVKFFVEDTGIGIDATDLENIFDHFYKVEKEDSRLYRGTGIGLSICKKLIQLMGGEIWVQSTIDHGSVFYFTLPYQDALAKPDVDKQQPQRQQYNLKDAKILVAEDELNNFKLIEKILKNTSAALVWVRNGKEAIEFIEQNADEENLVVLMDIKMPVMDGYEAHRQIKRINANIPVIAVTAYAQQEDEQKIREEKFDDYVIKPIYPEKLLKVIAQHINTST